MRVGCGRFDIVRRLLLACLNDPHHVLLLRDRVDINLLLLLSVALYYAYFIRILILNILGGSVWLLICCGYNLCGLLCVTIDNSGGGGLWLLLLVMLLSSSSHCLIRVRVVRCWLGQLLLQLLMGVVLTVGAYEELLVGNRVTWVIGIL
jgi:hypothetical protein